MRWSDSLWHRPLRTLRRCGDMPFLQWTHVTLPQKRTAETPGAQRVKKRTMMDVRRSIRVRDAIRKLPQGTLRRCGDIPFL